MVTDCAEVFRLGTEKAQENLAFRRYLSAHRLSDRPFQIFAAEAQQEMDCRLCANCCKYSLVSVDNKEIANIAAHLGISPEEVTHTYTDRDPDSPAMRLLRTTPQGCIFLHNNHCSIYPARPSTCRDFPHVAVGKHSLGSRPSSIGRWAALCPIIYDALERHKRLTAFKPHPHQP